ncbi:MAG: outer membrane protein assembly factor BamE [Pseudobdellovibrionaceae bacterium]
MRYIHPALFASLALLAACSPVRETHGNFVPEYKLATLQPQVDTRSDVIKKIGSPTTVSPFDENVWYYIGQRTEKVGMFDPKIKAEKIYLAQFTPDGTLNTFMEVERDRMDIPLSDDKTPTGGNDYTVLQQLLGNLGKFNAPETSATDL